MPKKIVVIGPESTGKSKLCEALAQHYQTKWVKEFAREYLITNGKAYMYSDVLKIAKGQIASEDAAASDLSDNELLFVDTDLHVMKIWSEYVFNNCDLNILNGIVTREYDLYLLMNTDLPWEKDELREYPDPVVREKLFHHFLDTLVHQSVPFRIISGVAEARTQNAIKAIDAFLHTLV